jgi:hypothetical protein
MTEPSAPSYRLLATVAEANAAIEEVIALAQQRLRVFGESARTLRERGFAAPLRIATLRHLLHGSRHHRLDIVLHDVQGIEVELPRLIALLGNYSGQVAIRRTLGAAREARDALVIADDAHFWHKLHAEHPRSVLTLHDPGATRVRADRFAEILDLSELAVSGTQLGL